MMLFFVSLGLQVAGTPFTAGFGPLVSLTLFVLIGHPLILYLVIGALGYRSRTAFLVSMPTAQVSEFALIIGAIGLQLQLLSANDVSLITSVSLVTYLFSTYFITYNHQLLRWLRPVLTWPRVSVKSPTASSALRSLTNHTIVVGARHLGNAIIKATQRHNDQVMVIDLDPHTVESLIALRIPAILGDASEEELLEQARLPKAAQLISTVGERDVNLAVVRLARSLNRTLRIIVVARDASDALILYEAGADYVAITHHISGDVLVRFLDEVTDHPRRLKQIRQSHIEELKSDHVDFRLAHHHLGQGR